jgi:Domain of unknown function (DUF4347)/FG-GAP-like repeat/FG-GAP repeat
MLNTQNRSISAVNSQSIAGADSGAIDHISATTLVVFDDQVSDLEILYQALLPGAVGFTINSQDDGLAEITRLLVESEAKFLSIVAHGEPGVIHLGRKPIDIEQIQNQSQLLQEWGVKEIALYSCEVAQGNVGKNLIDQLSELTGATVAASDTKTGCAKLGGSWDLTITAGKIAVPQIFEPAILQNYPAILISVGLVAGINPVEGGLLGTFEISLDAPAPVGGIVVNFTTTGTTATPNLDYALSAGVGLTAVTANTFTIAAGATRATLNVIAFRDAVIDPNEIITITTTSGIGYTIDSFVPANNITLGLAPNTVAVGDFNGDGKLDLATANQTASSISVLLGNGAGGFGAKTDFIAGTGSVSVTVGDFNGDGKLDLATANFTANSVSVLLGNGVGGFSAKTDFIVGLGSVSVTVGDFNGDGKLDLATANFNASSVSVLLGNGAGGFSTRTDFNVGIRTSSVTVGDLNGDGILDLATTNQNANSVSVLLGNGAGGFGAKTDFIVGATPTSLTVGDFNGDGKLDLVTTSFSSVSVLLGNGAGGFGVSTDFTVGLGSNSVVAGDLNGDGKLDLSTANRNANSVSVLLGNGAGGFGTKTDFTVGSFPTTVTIGDFNGDGKLDLSTANFSGNSISVLLNNNEPTASLGIFDTPFNRRNDFGKDRKSDILWRNTDGTVAIWQMNGAAVSTANIVLNPGNTWNVAGTSDFNGDGKSDILWRNADGTVALWQMNGGTISSSNYLNPYLVDNNWKVASTIDFNGDSKSDILWRYIDGTVAIWQMNGANVLSAKIVSSLDNTWKLGGTGDFNGDGKADILWRNDNGSLALWQMDGTNISSGSFLSPTPSIDSSWKIAGVDDFNGDGKADILWRNIDGTVALWQMNGSNTIAVNIISVLDNTWKITGTGDFNGDGKADILWRNNDSSTALWQMNGANIAAAGFLSSSPDNGWQVASL